MKLLSIVTGALAPFLPERTRRMVFVASIVAFLTHQKNASTETIHRLNKIFMLANSDREKVIELPMLLCTVIWEGTESEKICREEYGLPLLNTVVVPLQTNAVIDRRSNRNRRHQDDIIDMAYTPQIVREIAWSDEKTDAFLQKIMPTIPSWLRYQNTMMEEDIRSLFGSGLIVASHS